MDLQAKVAASFVFAVRYSLDMTDRSTRQGECMPPGREARQVSSCCRLSRPLKSQAYLASGHSSQPRGKRSSLRCPGADRRGEAARAHLRALSPWLGPRKIWLAKLEFCDLGNLVVPSLPEGHGVACRDGAGISASLSEQ